MSNGNSSGWNRPTSNQPTAKKGGAKAPSMMKGIIVGAVAVVVGIVCIFAFSGKSEKPVEKSEKTGGRIKEVKHVVATNEVAKPTPPQTKEEKRLAQLKRIRDKYGDNIPDNLKPVVYYLENPPQTTYHPNQSKFSYLKHKSERTLATLLTARPGTLLIRQPHFNEGFDAELRAAAIEKIEIADDDPEDVKEIKKAVQETKDELVERVKAGEKASDIMNAETKALYELGMLRHELEIEVAKANRDPSKTDDEVRDFVNAANIMLEQRGSIPVRSPVLMYRQTSLALAAERRKKQQKDTSTKGQ